MSFQEVTGIYPKAKKVPSRFRHALGKHRITITGACNNCGLCITLCPYGVYKAGARRAKGIA